MRLILSLSLLLWAGGLSAQLSKSETKQMLRMLQSAPTFDAVIDSLSRRDIVLDSASIPVAREALWQRLLEEQARFPARKTAFARGECNYAAGKTGLFSMKTKGEQPAHGYPVYIGLHGGGGGPKEMNDEQWEQMQTYYLEGIDTGLYVAPRGPNNTWNLHFDDDAMAFYDRLLMDLRLFAGADPNRVYLLGYSAGGDGVYQLAPRLAPQLAAASMSAGHHNGVSPVNLVQVPMLLQVGELDAAYDRNRETVKYAERLDSLARLYPGAYAHNIYVHAGAEHSYVRDRQGINFKATVLSEPGAWLRNPARSATTMAVTDAPTWLQGHVRHPYPALLRCDASTSGPAGKNWYWISYLEAGNDVRAAGESMELHLDRAVNRIEILHFSGPFTIHLHESMVDFRKPIAVVVAGKEFLISRKPSMLEIARTMLASGDPNYGFCAAAHVSRNRAGEIEVK